MGVTISTAKLAAAFKADNGNTYYVLFEESYDKNCYPHTPTWCCISIGSLATVLQRVFGSAAACAGGGLRVRGGRSAPEQYIADWLAELANPVLMHNVNFSLKIGEDFYASIPKEKANEILNDLTEKGHEQITQVLRAGGSCDGSIHANPDLVEAVYGNRYTAPWRIIRATPLHAPRVPELGYRPVPSKAAVPPPPAFLKVDRETRLIKQEDGSWRCVGWEYQAIGEFVRSLWEQELREPGTYRKLIKAFTKAAQEAPAIHSGMKVVVNMQVPLASKWAHENRVALQEKHLTGIEITPNARGFEFIAPINNASAMYHVCALPSECTTWVCETITEA